MPSKTKKIGFVAAKPIPQVLLNINSFLLGARSVDPTITCQVIFTGEWSLAVKEAEATNALVDAGCDVITCHVDSPKVVIETAAGRGAFVCGYHANQTPLAPEKYLTGAEWNWAERLHRHDRPPCKAASTLPNFVRGGLADGFIKMRPLGPAVVRGRARAVRGDARPRSWRAASPSIKGPLKDNTGRSRRRRGRGLRGNGRRAGKHGLSGRGRHRLDLVRLGGR